MTTFWLHLLVSHSRRILAKNGFLGLTRRVNQVHACEMNFIINPIDMRKYSPRIAVCLLITFFVFIKKLFDTPRSVNKFLFPCIKRMAFRTNFRVKAFFGHRRTCRKSSPTTTGHGYFMVFRMNGFFHSIISWLTKKQTFYHASETTCHTFLTCSLRKAASFLCIVTFCCNHFGD
jgi:hypothetical protein